MSSGASPQLAFSFRARKRRPQKRRKPGRPELPSRFPVHVTYRLVRRLPSARRPAVFRAIRRAFNEGRAWLDFAVVAPQTWLLQNAERALRIARPPSTPAGGCGSPQPGAAGTVAPFRTSTP